MGLPWRATTLLRVQVRCQQHLMEGGFHKEFEPVLGQKRPHQSGPLGHGGSSDERTPVSNTTIQAEEALSFVMLRGKRRTRSLVQGRDPSLASDTHYHGGPVPTHPLTSQSCREAVKLILMLPLMPSHTYRRSSWYTCMHSKCRAPPGWPASASSCPCWLPRSPKGTWHGIVLLTCQTPHSYTHAAWAVSGNSPRDAQHAGRLLLAAAALGLGQQRGLQRRLRLGGRLRHLWRLLLPLLLLLRLLLWLLR